MGKKLTFVSASSPWNLLAYRRAETADGPRRRESVLHMRAQMLRSLFLARHGSIHGRFPPIRWGAAYPPCIEICAFLSQEHTLELGPIFS